MAKLSYEVDRWPTADDDAALECFWPSFWSVCDIAELQHPVADTTSMLLLAMHGELGTVQGLFKVSFGENGETLCTKLTPSSPAIGPPDDQQ